MSFNRPIASRSGGRAKPGGGFELAVWYLMRLTGLGLFVLALSHFLITHVLWDPASENASFITTRWANLAVRTADWLMLAFVVFHAFMGLRTIVGDYTRGGARTAPRGRCCGLRQGTRSGRRRCGRCAGTRRPSGRRQPGRSRHGHGRCSRTGTRPSRAGITTTGNPGPLPRAILFWGFQRTDDDKNLSAIPAKPSPRSSPLPKGEGGSQVNNLRYVVNAERPAVVFIVKAQTTVVAVQGEALEYRLQSGIYL